MSCPPPCSTAPKLVSSAFLAKVCLYFPCSQENEFASKVRDNPLAFLYVGTLATVFISMYPQSLIFGIVFKNCSLPWKPIGIEFFRTLGTFSTIASRVITTIRMKHENIMTMGQTLGAVWTIFLKNMARTCCFLSCFFDTTEYLKVCAGECIQSINQ